MPTSPATTSDPRRAPAFTLVELMIVMGLLAVLMFLALPAFQSLLEGTGRRETARLTGVIRMLRNEAVLARKPYRLVIDLKEGEYFVEERTLDGQFLETKTPPILARHRFPPAFKLRDLILNGNTRYPLTGRKVELQLDVSGFMDPFALRYTVDGEPFTLKVAGFTAEVEVVKGHDLE